MPQWQLHIIQNFLTRNDNDHMASFEDEHRVVSIVIPVTH